MNKEQNIMDALEALRDLSAAAVLNPSQLGRIVTHDLAAINAMLTNDGSKANPVPYSKGSDKELAANLLESLDGASSANERDIAGVIRRKLRASVTCGVRWHMY